MMISIPAATAVYKELFVYGNHLSKVDGNVVKVDFNQDVKAMVCDNFCKYMFPLDPKIVFILNNAEDLKISTAPKENGPRNAKKKPSGFVEPKNMVITGKGFAEILTKSTAPW